MEGVYTTNRLDKRPMRHDGVASRPDAADREAPGAIVRMLPDGPEIASREDGLLAGVLPAEQKSHKFLAI